jgi:hypothetical protein
MTREFSVEAFAIREQVSTRTVRRWLKKGRVVGRKTPGAHRWRVLAEVEDDDDAPASPANAARDR